MIHKRYQYYTKRGIVWTEWFKVSDDDSLLETFKKENTFQFGKKLLNEFKIVK